MFLRFYKQSQENIDKCIEEMKPHLTGLKEIKQGKIDLSVNTFLPPETDTEKNVQLDLIFNTKNDEDAAYKNKNCYAIYQKYCSTIKGAEATQRKPGDISVSNPSVAQPTPTVSTVAGMPGLFQVSYPVGTTPHKIKKTPIKKLMPVESVKNTEPPLDPDELEF